MREVRSHAAVVVIGVFAVRLAAYLIAFFQEEHRSMYIDPWLFLVLVFGTALSVSGLLIGAIAVVSLWLRRRPRRRRQPTPSGLIGPKGEAL